MKRFVFSSLAIIVILGICSFLFYWYQIRPSQIKHECSWIKRHANAIPGRSAMTRAELEAKGIIRTCKEDYALVKKLAPNFDLDNDVVQPYFGNSDYTMKQTQAIWDARSCREDSDKVINEYKNPIKPVSAKDWYEAADKDEYTFCLHDKGL